MKALCSRSSIFYPLIFLVTIFSVIPLDAAENRTFSIDTKIAATQSREHIYLEDQPKHELTQTVSTRTMTSSNPDFHDMHVVNFGQSDSIAGTGTHTGYSFYYHKNGDKVFTRYQGTHKTTLKEDKSWESVAEGELEILGGTGMFGNISGGGAYTCTYTKQSAGCHADLKAQY